MQAGGAQTDRDKGVQDLRLTAEKGRYLSPYARLLLAVAALRSKDVPKARDLLERAGARIPAQPAVCRRSSPNSTRPEF